MFNEKFIPLSVPSFKGNELKYVTECIETEWVSTAGSYVGRFEKELSEYVGSGYAVATSNGTAALHVSLIVSGVTPGDEVIVPTVTFIAPVNTVRYVGAEPVFMDCDEWLNIDPEKVRLFCETECDFDGENLVNRTTGFRVKAIIPVHVFGHPVNIDLIMDIAEQFNLAVIEDATESLGSYYRSGKYAGKKTGTIGHIGCFSFNGNKIITSGGGGMIVTDDEEIAAKAKYLTTQAKNDDVYYVHDEVGFNYRMTNLQAALGVAQLEQLDTYIEIKRNNFDQYSAAIGNIHGLSVVNEPDYSFSNYWMYSLRVSKSYPKNRDDLIIEMKKRGIQCRPLWKLNHLQEAYKRNTFYDICLATELYPMILNLPCSVNMDLSDINRVAEVLINESK